MLTSRMQQPTSEAGAQPSMADNEQPPSPAPDTSPSLTVTAPSNRSKTISALGLDVGRKRIGVAGCDRTGLIATGLTTIERRSFEEDVTIFKQIVAERQVEILVVGLPYSMDGTLGFQAKQVQKYAKRIAKALQLPFEFVDERLTSFQAEQLIQAEARSPSRNKSLIDRKAASIILQQWLDERRARHEHSPCLEPYHV